LIIVASVTIGCHTHRLMTLIAKFLATGMAFLASIKSYLSPPAVTDNILPYFSQKLPMVEAHVLGIPDTFIILRIGPLQNHLRRFRPKGHNLRYNPVQNKNQNY